MILFFLFFFSAIIQIALSIFTAGSSLWVNIPFVLGVASLILLPAHFNRITWILLGVAFMLDIFSFHALGSTALVFFLAILFVKNFGGRIVQGRIPSMALMALGASLVAGLGETVVSLVFQKGFMNSFFSFWKPYLNSIFLEMLFTALLIMCITLGITFARKLLRAQRHELSI